MEITIIICTYNRCESLAKTLDGVVGQKLPTSVEWEILVVDNNSRDQTREAVEDFCRRYPDRLRYFFEPKQGKSHALNSGIRQARGEVLAFTDDDVTVEPTWLQKLTAAFQNGQWAGAGGRTVPRWTCSPPRWLPLEDRYAFAPLAVFDLGPDAGELAEAPFGNNMAFRKAMFEKYGGFRTDLGPQPGSEIRDEDTEFGSRLLAAGERLRYEPSAVVYHPVPKSRLQKEYFLAWWFDKGRADIRQFGIRTGTKWCCKGVPLRLFRNLAVWTLRWVVAVKPGRRFSRKLTVWGKVGEILECYRNSIDTRRGLKPAASRVPPQIRWPTGKTG